MGRENTKKFSSTKSLAGLEGSALEPTTNSTNADVKSNESGVGAVAGDLSHLVYDQPKQKVIEPDYFGKGWVDWFRPYSLDNNPTVNPKTIDKDTNNLDTEKTPIVTNGADAGADSDIQIDQSDVTSVPEQNGTDSTDHGRGTVNGNGNGAEFVQPNITYINDAIDRQKAETSQILKGMEANFTEYQAYAEKVNTSLMEEINGLYEANGKQNELNDLIIDATSQKWMTQLGDEIVPIQSQNAFKEPLPLKQFDVSSITGSKYFIFIVVGIIALIGLSMLKGKGSGTGTGVNVTRYG